MAKIGARSLPRHAPDKARSKPARPTPPDNLLATPIKGSRSIAARLRQAILYGAYGHGERLPAERDLAQMLGTSRTTIRKALSRLEETRLVTRRIGSGTYVNYPANSEEDIAEITSPLELIEVRLAVERHAIRLAVINATARDMERLGEALKRLEASGADAEHFSHWDEQFHLRIAQSTHNPLLVWMYRQINHVRGHAQWRAMKDKILTARRIAEYNRQHRSLYEALLSRDPDGAVKIITDHLTAARRHLAGADRV
ncbi:MAG: FadR family transcriptional regulator [Proteobacteria bacterium]|nr:FadR family transcriptional regulator [Pseudomonadota bacterium]